MTMSNGNDPSKTSNAAEEREFKALVKELRLTGLVSVNDLACYFQNKQTGANYRNLFGELELSEDGDTWTYSDAISPKYYARLCRELGLGVKKTNAVPGRFNSDKD